MKRAVVLLSGGLDSTTTLAIAKHEGYEIFALSFEYGQRHRIEIDSAKQIGQSLGVREHRIAKIDLRVFGGSALTDAIDVPKYRSDAEIAGQIPVTYVPARNTIFLSYALAWAETIEARDIFIGANARDYSGYPDCRPEFIEQFEQLANLGTRAGISGERFRIDSHCQSACTMFLSIRNVCVSPGATLLFHAGGTRLRGVSPGRTQQMLSTYNAALQQYVTANHFMDTLDFHTISGSEIIKRFGYPACR